MAVLQPIMINTDIEEDYEIIEIIGTSKGATIKTAMLRESEKHFTIKSVENFQSQVDQENLITEINLMRKLDHRHILKIRRIYEDEKYVHIVYDLTESDLHSTLKLGNPLNEVMAARVIYNILSALHYLHSQGIMHCNIKPESIFIGEKI